MIGKGLGNQNSNDEERESMFSASLRLGGGKFLWTHKWNVTT